MTPVLSRSDWGALPPEGMRRFDPDKVRGVAVHFNGGAVAEKQTYDPEAYLRGVQRFHMETKGWADIAYNLAVDQRGRMWTLRGLLSESAANGNATVNDEWVAILGILGGDQAPTPQMLTGIRYGVSLTRARYPRATRIIGHRDVRSTDCPGERLYAHVRAGTFDPGRPPAKEEKMPTQREVNDFVERAAKDTQIQREFRRLAGEGAVQALVGALSDRDSALYKLFRAVPLQYPVDEDDPETLQSEALSLLGFFRELREQLDRIESIVAHHANPDATHPPEQPEPSLPNP